MTDLFAARRYIEHRIRRGDAGEDYDHACRRAWMLLDGSHREVLAQLVDRGPIWDGDIVSKSARDDLFDLGLAGRACVKGEQGFSVANYIGWAVYKRGTEAK